MDEKKYKPGDVVMLVSGGPEMTVFQCINSDQVRCNWFGGGIELKTGAFVECTLMPVDKSKK